MKRSSHLPFKSWRMQWTKWAILEERGVGSRNPKELKLELAKRVIELAAYGDYDPQTHRDIAVASLDSAAAATRPSATSLERASVTAQIERALAAVL